MHLFLKQIQQSDFPEYIKSMGSCYSTACRMDSRSSEEYGLGEHDARLSQHGFSIYG